MKKLIIILTLFLITGCSNVKYSELPDNGGMDGLTYKFVGESKNYVIKTGNLYFKDVEKQLLMTNFQAIKEIKADKMKVEVLLDDKEYREIEYIPEMNVTPNEFLENIFITDFTLLSRDSKSAFAKTTEDSIKKDLGIKITKCLDNKCETETLKLDFKK